MFVEENPHLLADVLEKSLYWAQERQETEDLEASWIGDAEGLI